MKLDNVFYGFTKDGQRKLIWRKKYTEFTLAGTIVTTRYYDLENKEYIEVGMVDVDSLLPITRLVGDYKRKSKRKVINAYKADCNKLYDVSGMFYGNILDKMSKYEFRTASGYFAGSAGMDLYDDVLITTKKNVLFARIDDSRSRVESLENGSLYPWSYRIQKGYCVNEIRPVNKKIFSKPVINKKLLLEADYKKLL